MDHALTPDEQNFMIEDALNTYPVVPMPRDIATDVMARIQTVPAPRSFRLTWNDLVLGVVLAMCIGAIWFSLHSLPPLFVAQIRKESILLYQQIILNTRWLILLLPFVFAGFFAALTIPYWRQEFTK